MKKMQFVVAGRMVLLALCLLPGSVVWAWPWSASRPVLAPLAVTVQQVKVVQPRCEGDKCPVFSIERPVFTDDAVLTLWLEKQLVQMATGAEFAGNCGKTDYTLEAVAGHYFAPAEGPRPGCWISARVSLQVIDVVVLQLHVGTPGHSHDQVVNYDRVLQRPLTLDDVLLPGQKPAYYAAIASASAGNPATAAACVALQPGVSADACVLPQSEEFEFVPGGMAIVYRAAPGADGLAPSWKFMAGYVDLKGIVRPEWLPGA